MLEEETWEPNVAIKYPAAATTFAVGLKSNLTAVVMTWRT